MFNEVSLEMFQLLQYSYNRYKVNFDEKVVTSTFLESVNKTTVTTTQSVQIDNLTNPQYNYD